MLIVLLYLQGVKLQGLIKDIGRVKVDRTLQTHTT